MNRIHSAAGSLLVRRGPRCRRLLLLPGGSVARLLGAAVLGKEPATGAPLPSERMLMPALVQVPLPLHKLVLGLLLGPLRPPAQNAVVLLRVHVQRLLVVRPLARPSASLRRDCNGLGNGAVAAIGVAGHLVLPVPVGFHEGPCPFAHHLRLLGARAVCAMTDAVGALLAHASPAVHVQAPGRAAVCRGGGGLELVSSVAELRRSQHGGTPSRHVERREVAQVAHGGQDHPPLLVQQREISRRNQVAVRMRMHVSVVRVALGRHLRGGHAVRVAAHPRDARRGRAGDEAGGRRPSRGLVRRRRAVVHTGEPGRGWGGIPVRRVGHGALAEAQLRRVALARRVRAHLVRGARLQRLAQVQGPRVHALVWRCHRRHDLGIVGWVKTVLS
mmetsp:Transcript_4244/g.10725  ORF Transcript_4244/g.10725 Transcript_4244/m.10725 type:complete len:387 (+) Transcript_4244:184-1344(+)